MISFQDNEMIKVITGIRRCGKSRLMKLMVNHLKEQDISEGQIIEMNFESMPQTQNGIKVLRAIDFLLDG